MTTLARDVFVVDAVRTAVGRRGGKLSAIHPNELLAVPLSALFARTGVDPASVGQVVGGCVGQIGAQASNVTRQAWLTAGLPLEVPASTVNVQCGSSQQATTTAHAMVASGMVESAVACGVECMSAIPLGANIPTSPSLGKPREGRYAELYQPTTQFDGADRIAATWQIDRSELDEFGARSQALAARAWAAGRFDGQVVPVLDGITGPDEGLRETSAAVLGGLKPVRAAEPDGVHTAGTASQVSDGAAALLLMSAAEVERTGAAPVARLVDSVTVGSDPVLMLTGPIPATWALLERASLTIDDVDVFEVNEAFASVVLAWQRELKPDPDRVNPNGGAIALGHPLGATGAILLTKAVHELARTGGDRALVTMCCGGGLGTGTLLERI
ncbi:acetyl-CoA C-acyltransferase [Pseudonocardia sp. RS010]|uniref:acetyl-CoA C-acyltransferase n=1 Tax=Pseudonocardia sp. RS010 TaxID=3385979 RepID=UPI0039A3CFF9